MKISLTTSLLPSLPLIPHKSSNAESTSSYKHVNGCNYSVTTKFMNIQSDRVNFFSNKLEEKKYESGPYDFIICMYLSFLKVKDVDLTCDKYVFSNTFKPLRRFIVVGDAMSLIQM